MSNDDLMQSKVTLVIFTCTGRAHLLIQTIESFRKHVDYKFGRIILSVDGKINEAAYDVIAPDLILRQYDRKGYVHSILSTLQLINTPYFFWLEDDWNFNERINIEYLLSKLSYHKHWAQIILSKYGPLNDAQKENKLIENFYETNFGFSANPCLCDTAFIKSAFDSLASSKKGNTLGEDGFENYLSRYFKEKSVISVILDPENHYPITHDGYLETTPRNWHMTNSLENKTEQHLLTIPAPSIPRRLLMIVKLSKTFLELSFRQLFNKKIYELCFRVVTSSEMAKKDD